MIGAENGVKRQKFKKVMARVLRFFFKGGIRYDPTLFIPHFNQ
jgi:hypothetical protein